MKIYKKPELDIVEFDVIDVITNSDILPLDEDPELKLSSDQVFYGDDEGYLVN